MAIPANSVLPIIPGTPEVGQTLSATTGTWTGVPTSFSYQWQRYTNDPASANCGQWVNIAGATTSSYTLTSSDAATNGKVIGIRCAVTGINASGSSTANSDRSNPWVANYVSPTATDGAGTGTLANPWSILDGLKKATVNSRNYVREGSIYPTVTATSSTADVRSATAGGPGVGLAEFTPYPGESPVFNIISTAASMKMGHYGFTNLTIGTNRITQLVGAQMVGSGGVATLTVTDTTGFATSGSVYVRGYLITYTGKTATTFTGCSSSRVTQLLAPDGTAVLQDGRMSAVGRRIQVVGGTVNGYIGFDASIQFMTWCKNHHVDSVTFKTMGPHDGCVIVTADTPEPWSEDMRVVNCDMDCSGPDGPGDFGCNVGVQLRKTENQLIQNCKIYNITYNSFNHTDGVRLYAGGRRVRWIGNEFGNNQALNIFIKDGNAGALHHDIIIENNLCYGVNGGGFRDVSIDETTYGLIIRNNTCDTIAFNSAGTVYVQMFYNNIAITIKDTGAGNPAFEFNGYNLRNDSGGSQRIASGVNDVLGAPTYVTGTYIPALTSLGLNAGIKNPFPNVDLISTKDKAGRPRLVGSTYDIGAFERQSTDP